MNFCALLRNFPMEKKGCIILFLELSFALKEFVYLIFFLVAVSILSDFSGIMNPNGSCQRNENLKHLNDKPRLMYIPLLSKVLDLVIYLLLIPFLLISYLLSIPKIDIII